MQKIPLALATAGMVLARDVRKSDVDTESPPICGKGVTLTEKLIDRLSRMGIQAVTVEGHPVDSEDDKTLDAMLAELDTRFSRVAGDPLMKKIKGIYRNYLIKSMG